MTTTAAKKSAQRGDLVQVKRDVTRHGAPYARKGDRGRVEEVFRTPPQDGVNGSWHAKVLFGEDIKTLRLISVEKVTARACYLCSAAFSAAQHEFVCPRCGAECAGTDVT